MTEPQQTGAPSALAYISQREAAARAKLDAAELFLDESLRLQRENPAHLDGINFDERVQVARIQRDAAKSDHKDEADMLLKYDSKVSAERRDASEKISREEAVSLFRAFAIYARCGAENMITQFADQVLSCQTQQEVYALHADRLRDCLRNSMDSAKREKQLPDWAAQSLDGFI